MNTKLIELAERRATLVARARAQREELSGTLASWRSPLGMIDQGIAAIGFVKRYPVVLAGIVTLGVVFRPVRLMKWLPPGWLMWRAVRVALEAGRILPGWWESCFRSPRGPLTRKTD